MQSRLHEIADKQIVEHLVADRRHQRGPRHLEGDPDRPFAWVNDNLVITATHTKSQKADMIAQQLLAQKVRRQLSYILARQLIVPVVAEGRRRQHDRLAFGGVDRRDLLTLNVIVNEGRKVLDVLCGKAIRVGPKRRRVLLRPDAIFPLIAVEGAERYHMRCAIEARVAFGCDAGWPLLGTAGELPLSILSI